jgi:DASS family divalent anion:Na+ symporter
MIGLVSIIKYIGLDAQIAEQLSFIGHNMKEQFYLFVLMLIGVIFILRIFLPITASGLLAATVFIPLADASGVNPWVVAFFILMIAENWWLPYQSSYYLLFETLNEKHRLYDQATFMRINTLTILIRLAAIFVSIPYFQSAGLL